MKFLIVAHLLFSYALSTYDPTVTYEEELDVFKNSKYTKDKWKQILQKSRAKTYLNTLYTKEIDNMNRLMEKQIYDSINEINDAKSLIDEHLDEHIETWIKKSMELQELKQNIEDVKELVPKLSKLIDDHVADKGKIKYLLMELVDLHDDDDEENDNKYRINELVAQLPELYDEYNTYEENVENLIMNLVNVHPDQLVEKEKEIQDMKKKIEVYIDEKEIQDAELMDEYIEMWIKKQVELQELEQKMKDIKELVAELPELMYEEYNSYGQKLEDKLFEFINVNSNELIEKENEIKYIEEKIVEKKEEQMKKESEKKELEEKFKSKIDKTIASFDYTVTDKFEENEKEYSDDNSDSLSDINSTWSTNDEFFEDNE